MKEYILSERMFKILSTYLKRKKKKLVCTICGEPLKIGECIVSKGGGCSGKHFFHCSCYHGHLEPKKVCEFSRERNDSIYIRNCRFNGLCDKWRYRYEDCEVREKHLGGRKQ